MARLKFTVPLYDHVGAKIPQIPMILTDLTFLFKQLQFPNNSAKTPISVLHELMIKHNDVPEFKFVRSMGPPHDPVFVYEVGAAGVSVEASGKTKKDAKQEAAKMCLAKLAEKGVYSSHGYVPAPTGTPAEETELLQNTNVALLKELCIQYTIQQPEYVLMSDTGPSHSRWFVKKCKVGSHERTAGATTKKQARQLAAGKLYNFLKENLKKVLEEHGEDSQAMVSIHDKAAQRYTELRDDMPWKPNLGQKISDYHLGFKKYLSKEQQMEVLQMLDPDVSDPIQQIEMVLKVCDLEFEWVKTDGVDPTNERFFYTLHVPHSYPTTAITAVSSSDELAKKKAALETMEHIKELLC